MLRTTPLDIIFGSSVSLSLTVNQIDSSILILITEIYVDPSEEIESEYFKPEMIALVLLFCLDISFWENEDNGHWEEAKKVEASSVGNYFFP